MTSILYLITGCSKNELTGRTEVKLSTPWKLALRRAYGI
jgi:hypothetical protein